MRMLLRIVPHRTCELAVHDGKDGLHVPTGKSFRGLLQVPAYDTSKAMLRSEAPLCKLGCKVKTCHYSAVKHVAIQLLYCKDEHTYGKQRGCHHGLPSSHQILLVCYNKKQKYNNYCHCTLKPKRDNKTFQPHI